MEHPWFDEATGRVDVETFERFTEQSRLEGLGSVPGPVVSERTLRVEQQKRRPVRTLVRFVLDCGRDDSATKADLPSVDDYSFEARSENRDPVVYRSTNPRTGCSTEPLIPASTMLTAHEQSHLLRFRR